MSCFVLAKLKEDAAMYAELFGCAKVNFLLSICVFQFITEAYKR
jgi:hypothetical protein